MDLGAVLPDGVREAIVAEQRDKEGKA